MPRPSSRSTSEYRVVGSTRRTATVASAVPDASSARGQRLGAGHTPGARVADATRARCRRSRTGPVRRWRSSSATVPLDGPGPAAAQPPAAAVTISTVVARCDRRRSQVLLGTTSPSTATATPRGDGHRRPPGRPRWYPASAGEGSPLTVVTGPGPGRGVSHARSPRTTGAGDEAVGPERGEGPAPGPSSHR